MKKNLLALLAVPALLAVMASCNKNEPVSATTGSAGSESSVWNSVTFTKDGATTDYKGDKWWPNSNPNYHFFASNAPITFAAAGSTVAATNATDVICAYMASPTYKSKNTLTFEHVFARLGDVEVSAADGYTISGVNITVTPKTGGTFNMRTGAGKTDGTGWSSLTTGTATAIANATPGTKSNDIYLVPGTYTLTASWTAERGGYTEDIAGMTADVVLTGGRVNKITTTLGGNAQEVVFGVTVQPWGNTSVDVEFPTADPANGHAYVDLGLRDGSGNRVLFATMNVGASSPEDYGDYFAWGETTKRYTSISGATVTGGSFNVTNAPYHTGDSSSRGWTKYTSGEDAYAQNHTPDGKITLEASDDVASVQWGGEWRMPDESELEMLISSSVNYEWTSDWNSTGVAGLLVTGKGEFSSASLFLPAAENCNATQRYNYNEQGYYWSRCVFDMGPHTSIILTFSDCVTETCNFDRYYGLSVRPVLVLPE